MKRDDTHLELEKMLWASAADDGPTFEETRRAKAHLERNAPSMSRVWPNLLSFALPSLSCAALCAAALMTILSPDRSTHDVATQGAGGLSGTDGTIEITVAKPVAISPRSTPEWGAGHD